MWLNFCHFGKCFDCLYPAVDFGLGVETFVAYSTNGSSEMPSALCIYFDVCAFLAICDTRCYIFRAVCCNILNKSIACSILSGLVTNMHLAGLGK